VAHANQRPRLTRSPVSLPPLCLSLTHLMSKLRASNLDCVSCCNKTDCARMWSGTGVGASAAAGRLVASGTHDFGDS
jgi:hypothetical protein